MNTPNEVGWWAFEGRYKDMYFNTSYNGKEVRFIRQVIFHKEEDGLCVLNLESFAPLPVKFFDGRWEKVMPFWEFEEILEEEGEVKW